MPNLQPLANGVWLFPHDPDERKVQPSVGVVSDGNQTILIDSGNGVPHARQIVDALDRINAPPISHIIYTHHHWDHIFGAYYFNVPTIAHVLCYEALRPKATRTWSEDSMDTQVRREGNIMAVLAANPDWKDFRIVLPEVTFDHRLTIPLQGMSIHLEHVGGYHARDSIIVQIKEARVMFMGDAFYPSHEVKRRNWHMLSKFLAQKDYDTFVSGHMPPIFRRNRVQFLFTRFQAHLGSMRDI
jgi:glyoxylase-like metal-dependent hydrolase (beta-lactamase superfamily II)